MEGLLSSCDTWWLVPTCPVLLDLPAAKYTTSGKNCVKNNMSIRIQNLLSNMFQSTWPSLGNRKHIHYIRGVNSKIKYYEKKDDLIWRNVQRFITYIVVTILKLCTFWACFQIISKTCIIMNFCTLCRIEIFLFIEINVAMNLPSILYIFCITWRWPSWLKWCSK